MKDLLSFFRLLSPLGFMEFLTFAWASWAIPLATGVLSYMGSKGQKGQTVSTQTNDPWSTSIPYLENSMQQAQMFGASPLPYATPQSMVASLNPLQSGVLNAANPALNTSRQLAGAAGQGMLPFLRGDYMNLASNPHLQAAIQAAIRPVTQAYTENVLPGIRSDFGGTDAFGLSRQGIAEGVASRGYLDTVADLSARMANSGYNSGLQATQRAFEQAPLVQGSQVLPLTQAWELGGMFQGQQQRELDAQGAFDRLLWQRIQDPFNLYSAAARGGQTSSVTSQSPTANPLLAGAGGAITGMQLYDIYRRNYRPATQAPQTQYAGGPGAYTGFDAPF